MSSFLVLLKFSPQVFPKFLLNYFFIFLVTINLYIRQFLQTLIFNLFQVFSKQARQLDNQVYILEKHFFSQFQIQPRLIWKETSEVSPNNDFFLACHHFRKVKYSLPFAYALYDLLIFRLFELNFQLVLFLLLAKHFHSLSLVMLLIYFLNSLKYSFFQANLVQEKLFAYFFNFYDYLWCFYFQRFG